MQANTDFLASVTGRVGYAFDNVLLYAKGGVALAGDKYNVSGVHRIGTVGPSTFKGWTIATAGPWAAAWIGRSRVIGP